MKSLANCTPREFFKQTNRIRIAAEEWLTATKILEIRQKMPDIEVTKPKDKDDLKESIEARRKAYADQMRNNTFEMLEAMFDTNADKTIELLALACFVEPKDVNKHTMSEYLVCVSELIDDAGVRAFFDSLVKLGVSSTGSAVAPSI